MTTNMIAWERDADGIVTLTMDEAGAGANTMNEAFISSLEATLDRIAEEADDITGIVLTSGKKTFFAGADLNLIIQATPADAEALEQQITRIKAALRRLETCGKPVAEAMN